MPPIDQALITWAAGMLLPAFFISAFVAFCLIPAFRAKSPATAGAFAFALAVGLGLFVHKLIGLRDIEIPSGSIYGRALDTAFVLMPGNSSWNRLLLAALAALLIGRFVRREEMQPTGAWIFRGATAFVIAWSVVPMSVRQEIDWLTPAFALTILVLWAILERLSTDVPGGVVAMCVAMAFVAAGVVLVHASIASLMEVALVLASASAGLAVAGWWHRADVGGAMPAVAVLLPGLLLVGNRETAVEQLPWVAFALPVFAPMLLAEAWSSSRWQEPRGRLLRTSVMVLLIVVPLAIAVLVAHTYAPLDLDAPM